MNVESTMAAKIITCSFSAWELISDYSYSWGGGTELISRLQLTAGVVARNYFPIAVTAGLVAADKNTHKYHKTSQNMTHFITQTHHTTPHIPTSVVFLDHS